MVLPLTPPFAFVHRTASRTPWAYDLPTSEVMPVRSKMPPTLISWAEPWARAAPAISRAKTPPDRIERFILSSIALNAGLLIRKGIQLPIIADGPPPCRKPVGLEDEKEDDGEAEDAHLDRREQLDEPGVRAGESRGAEAKHLRQEGDEDRAEDRAEDAAEAADDDHAQIVDPERDGKILRADQPRLVGEQRPRHPDVERADAEGEELVAEDVHAHHLGGDVVVADGDEGLAHLGAKEDAGEEEQRGPEREDEEVEAEVGDQLDPEEMRGRHADAVDAAGDRLPVHHQEPDDEVGGQGGHGQVEAFEPQRRDAEEHAGRRRG